MKAIFLITGDDNNPGVVFPVLVPVFRRDHVRPHHRTNQKGRVRDRVHVGRRQLRHQPPDLRVEEHKLPQGVRLPAPLPESQRVQRRLRHQPRAQQKGLHERHMQRPRGGGGAQREAPVRRN